MIESLSNYAFAIICSSFLLNIIQMILPSNDNKKYILFVCSVIVTIILITPVISFLNKDFNISEVLASNTLEYEELSNNELENYYKSELINTYKDNLEKDVIETLNNAGYEVLQMECEYDEKTLEPNYLRVEIKSKDGNIQPVRIEVLSGFVKEKSISGKQERRICRIII